MKKIIFIFLFLFGFIFAQEDYLILTDINFSSYCGAENILTMHQGIEYLVDKTFKFKKNNSFFISLRTAEMVFFWYPLSDLEVTLQHEIFGHGYRIRDLGKDIISVCGYGIDMPFPYGDGGGSTSYSYTSNLTSFLELAVSVGGVDATAILANRCKMKWMKSLKLDPKKAFLYLLSQHDLTEYILRTSNVDIFGARDGNDIQSYIKWINETYWYQKVLTNRDLKKSVIVNFLDPMSYYSIGSIFYYIFLGKEMPIPMIKIKNLKFLPNLRLGLAPYGKEYYLESFFSYKLSPTYAYLKFGEFAGNTYYGAGIETNIYRSCRNKIGIRFDFFNQPKIYFDGLFETEDNIKIGWEKQDLQKKINGFSSYLIFDNLLFKNKNVSLHTEIGYKTDGFLPGQAIRNSIIFRVGISFLAF